MPTAAWAWLACACPDQPDGFAPQTLIPLIDRSVYPEADFPAGQWDYQLHYAEHFDRANAVFAADPVAMVKAMMRAGNAAHRGKPARLAFVRRDGGHFGGKDCAPDLPIDTAVLTESRPASVRERTGAQRVRGAQQLERQSAGQHRLCAARTRRRAPVDAGAVPARSLALHRRDRGLAAGRADAVSRDDLEEVVVDSGHWMAQEKPVEVNAALARWLARRFPLAWRVRAPAPPAR
jgi:hypothetical protein